MPDDTQPTEALDVPQGGLIGVISAAGAIFVVALGLVIVLVVTIVALGTVQADERATVVTAALGVVGTVVGTYFGLRAGAAGRERAEAARDLESIKVQELAARVEPGVARDALDTALKQAQAVRKASTQTLSTL